MDPTGAGVVEFRDCALVDVVGGNGLPPKTVDGKRASELPDRPNSHWHSRATRNGSLLRHGCGSVSRLAGSAELLNGLSFLFPEIPSLPIRNRVLGQFSSKPWSAMGPIRISLYPFSIGLMFFTPLDLSFSCWFFWLLTRLQMIVTDMLGARDIYRFEQQTGAWLAFGCIPLWMGRRALWTDYP